jgi:hypothetical protein
MEGTRVIELTMTAGISRIFPNLAPKSRREKERRARSAIVKLLSSFLYYRKRPKPAVRLGGIKIGVPTVAYQEQSRANRYDECAGCELIVANIQTKTRVLKQ